MFALSFKEVSTVLVGIDLLEYLHKSLKAANGKYFEPVTLASAQKLEYPDPAFLDLRKWDKQGWLN